MNLTDNFTLDEMIASAVAERNSINNAPSPEVMRNLYELCITLEKVRTLCNNMPIHISSGYRSKKLNALIGGSDKSAHMWGHAADFTIPKFGTPKDVAERIILSNIAYDQIIWEGSWVHLAIADNPRRRALIAQFINGKATYRDWEWGQG